MAKLICESKYPMCPKDAQPGGIHQLRINDLSPTQFAVGKAEVDIKSRRMKHKYKHNPVWSKYSCGFPMVIFQQPT